MGYVRTSSTPGGFACTDIECFNGAQANWLTVSVFYMTIGGYIYFWRHYVYVCMHACVCISMHKYVLCAFSNNVLWCVNICIQSFIVTRYYNCDGDTFEQICSHFTTAISNILQQLPQPLT